MTDLVKGMELLNPLFSLSNLVRIAEYANTWVGTMAAVLDRTLDVQRLAPGTYRLDPQHQHRLNRIFSITALREADHTRAEIHPCAPQPPSASAHELLRPMLERLSLYWDSCSRRVHRCDPLRCPCADRKSAILNCSASIGDILGHILPTHTIAGNKW